ncbi:FAD/NAD(P)-binding oxidoreductase [Amycolatopsis sp. WGS_07]|uniref:NAD(P)/FAD-dependent oxidoreductase n=1 Tax=Amycolatopsis sp. WGS_07 TaxID=3076764 RepID=UPI0038736DE7
MSSYDVVVVGGGPSGLAAAAAASGNGLRVALVDASAQVGGQYWRRPSDQVPGQHGTTFESLRRRLVDVDHYPEHQVWLLEPAPGDHRLHLAPTHESVRTAAPPVLRARSLILCPGAYDRQLPIPGWDLPGVMAAGGVQALVKAHGSLPGRRAVVAGTGPFLLPVARQLAEAGAEVVAVCDANSPVGWMRTPLGALAVPSKVGEAVSYAASFARHRIPFRARTVVAAIEGDEKVDSVRIRKVDRTGRGETLDGIDLVALGWGFTPSLELILAAGAATRVDLDESLVAVVDAWQRTDVAGVYVAGEATGVGGALLALAEGEIAGMAAAMDHGRTVDRRRAGRLQRQVRRGEPSRPPCIARTPCPQVGGTGSNRTPRCAGAKRSPSRTSATPASPWGPSTHGPRSSWRARGWAGARAGCADSPRPNSPKENAWASTISRRCPSGRSRRRCRWNASRRTTSLG